MQEVILSDREFRHFQGLIHKLAGISLTEVKKPLVSGRLAKRIRHYGLTSFGDYFELVMREKDELQVAVDLLTTNETYFFREPRHMDFLKERILPAHPHGRTFRIWSAACSSGEECYTLAMVLTDCLGEGSWEIVGSDISSRVLEKARTGHYPMERIDGIPQDYLRRFCLKGTGRQAGTFLIDKNIRQHIQFRQINLNEPLPALGEFDVVFLRNVMIYFDIETKIKVVQRILPVLRPGGHFILSHSESLNGISDALESMVPSVYRKPYA